MSKRRRSKRIRHTCGRKRWEQPPQWNDDVEKALADKRLAFAKCLNEACVAQPEHELLRETKDEKLNQFQIIGNQAKLAR